MSIVGLQLLDGVNFLLEHDQPMVVSFFQWFGDSLFIIYDYLYQNTAVAACVPCLVQFPFVSDEADSFGALGRIEVILETVEVLMKSGNKWTLLKRYNLYVHVLIMYI